MVQASKVGMLAHVHMEIHNMVSFLRLIMWICDFSIRAQVQHGRLYLRSNGLNKKRMPDKKTLIYVMICG